MKKKTNALTILAIVLLLFGYSNCMQGEFRVAVKKNDDSSSFGALPPALVGKNTISVGVGTCGRINQPCVTVTICLPGTKNCQSIGNVLLDTGSYGLRLFKQVVALPLPPVLVGGAAAAECMSYSGGDTQWGPVKTADVIIASEIAPGIPIQIIDTSFGVIPSDCTNNSTSPTQAGYNGILGVGIFVEDCGPTCVNTVNNRIYFTCSGTTCDSAAMPLNKQVSNPVASMPFDDNGIILQLPSVSDAGVPSVAGTLTLGIGRQKDNTPPSGLSVFQADQYGNIQTSFDSTTYTTSFIDSGSNGIFFPSNFAACTSATGFYCPSSTQSLSATQIGSGGSPQKAIAFEVINADSVLVSGNPNNVFNNLGGKLGNDFVWGLPFLLGRTVYVGIEGKKSSLGTGPYWAY